MNIATRLLAGLTGLALGLGLVASAMADGTPDSTSISAAGALPTTACPAWTAVDYKFYRLTPTADFFIAGDGSCQKKASCAYGVNDAGTACKAPPPEPPAPTTPPATSTPPAPPAPTTSPATVAFSLDSTAVIGTYANDNWTLGGDPMPTQVTVECYNAGSGAMTGSWTYTGSTGPGALPASGAMYGTNVCSAVTSNSSGSVRSATSNLNVGCPASQAFDYATRTCSKSPSQQCADAGGLWTSTSYAPTQTCYYAANGWYMQFLYYDNNDYSGAYQVSQPTTPDFDTVYAYGLQQSPWPRTSLDGYAAYCRAGFRDAINSQGAPIDHPCVAN